MRDDNTLYVGVVGTLGTFSLGDLNQLAGVLAGLATVVYVVTKTVIAIRRRDRP